MYKHSKYSLVIGFLLSVSVSMPVFPQENFTRITVQATQPGARDFANTTSTVTVFNSQRRLRIVTGFNDYGASFDATGAQQPRSSAMAYAYSDDLGNTWRRRLIRPSDFIDSIIGSPSLAVMEPLQRGLIPTRIFYAAVATLTGGSGQTRIVVSASDDGGETFSPAYGAPQLNINEGLQSHQSPSICIDPEDTIILNARERTQYPLGRVMLAYIADQGTDRASIRVATGRPRDRERASSISWSLSTAVDDVAPADRPYMRHPVIQRVGGRNVIVFEIHRPVVRYFGSEDRELQLVAMEEYLHRPTLSTRWRLMANQPNDGRTMRFTSQTTTSATGYNPANNVAMMSFKTIPKELAIPGREQSIMPASNTGLLVWAGKQNFGPGWQTIHFQQVTVQPGGMLIWTPRVQVSNGGMMGMAFQPAVSARWDLWAVSWFQQDARSGRVRLMGTTRNGNTEWGAERNLTAIQSRITGSTTTDMPVCATSERQWGSQTSSVVIAQLLSTPWVLTLHVDSRIGECSDFSGPNSARFQEVAATRWRF